MTETTRPDEQASDQTVELPAQAGAHEPAEATGHGHHGDEDFRPSAGGWAARIGVVVALNAVVLALPVLLPYDYLANYVGLAAIFASVALSVNLLTGYLGQLSLGHQAFFGVGAFLSANMVTTLGLPFVVGLVVGGAAGALACLILGAVALRVRGLYLAIVTLAYGLLAENSLFLIRPLTGGGAGLEAPRPAIFLSDRAFAYVCLAVLAVLFVFDIRLLKSKAGRAIQAIRDDERVAASFGINITGYKLLAFVLSGTYAGLAGALYAHWLTQVVSAPFNLQLALTFVLMTVIGGLGNRVGAVIGGAFFAVIEPVLEAIFHLFGAELNPVLAPVIGAFLLVFTLIQYPGGIGQQISPIRNWIHGKRFDIHAMHDASAAKGGVSVGRP